MSLKDLPIAPGYSTSQNYLLGDFYAPSLRESVSYDRSAGFFSSSLIALAPLAYSNFVQRGGRIRLICSPHLSAEDALRLSAEVDPSLIDSNAIAHSISKLREADDLAKSLTTVLSSLIAAEILQLKFARPVGGAGIFHDKVGIFTDQEGNRLSFVGSANETASAWSGYNNHEQIETFCSWRNLEQQQRSGRHQTDFEEMWRNLRPGLKVDRASEAAAIVRSVSQPIEVLDSLERLKEILDADRQRSSEAKQVSRPVQSSRPLRDHQSKVLEAWETAGNRGLVRFATGGGKTLVGIEAARRWTSTGRTALILVPSELLHKQWLEEIRAEGLDAQILLAGAGSSREKWMDLLPTFSRPWRGLGPRLILSTYQTAVTPDFQERLRAGKDLLLIADEVHRMGSPDTRALFHIDAGGRLGLSATPERYGDEEGTAEIQDYFGATLQPEFSLADAIAARTLVPYDYFLESVRLTEDETEEWEKISKEMAKQLSISDGDQSTYFKLLAQKRARILKRAEEKANLARKVLDEYYEPGSHWLIYCESRAHLQRVREELEDGPWPILEYHSGNSELGSEVFQHFERGGVLLAIKCLDEGVDIPSIDNALILASTSNPREYVQRRGRILRRKDDKYSARLFDVVVLDDEGKLLAGAEALRAMEFASNARNEIGRTRLALLLQHMGRSDLVAQTAFETADEGD